MIKEKIKQLKYKAIKNIKNANSIKKIDNVYIMYFGKKGKFTIIIKNIKNIPIQKRPEIGKIINKTCYEIKKYINYNKDRIKLLNMKKKFKNEAINISMCSKKTKIGHKHPNSIILNEIENIFINMGYKIIEGPEIEYVKYNFTKLNIPKEHSVRDIHDTFFINNKICLRSQTSPVQIRVMEKNKLPIRVISPGRVFRFDKIDSTHLPLFHQIEGLIVDKNINFSNLKYILKKFMIELFNKKISIRFRPHYFPFTEPSAEMDIMCFKCNGNGCNFCKYSGWIEILGCGMVHPNVLKMCNINKLKYNGIAFGMGLERIVMLKYQIDDIRLLYENNIMFLKQF